MSAFTDCEHISDYSAKILEGQVGLGPEQPDLVADVPAPGKGFAKWPLKRSYKSKWPLKSLPTQDFLEVS